MRNKLQTNLTFLLDKAQLNTVQLSKNTGVPTTTIHRLLHDPELSPRLHTLKAIANFFQVNMSQLTGDEPLPDETSVHFLENTSKWHSVPLLSFEELAQWPSPSLLIESRRFIQTDIEISKNAYATQLHEEYDSTFKKTAIIIVDPEIQASHQHYVIAYHIPSTKASLRQYLLSDGKAFLLPLDTRLQAIPFSDEYELRGVVRQIRYDFVI